MTTSTKRLDFRNFLSNIIDGNSADVDFIVNFAERIQKEEHLTDDEIMKECLSFLARQSNLQHLREVGELNKQVAAGIGGLKDAVEWGNLSAIAEHALKSCIEASEAENKPYMKNYIASQKVRLAVMKSSSSSFNKIFTKEFLAEQGFAQE